MKLETQRFGTIEINLDEIYHFPQGLPGFEELRRFVLLVPDPEMPLSFLQSVDDGNISFIMTNPFLYEPSYEFDIPEEDQAMLEIQDERDVAVWVILSVQGRLEDATMNLLAPVVMNVRNRMGKQIVLQGSAYKTKHRLFPERSAVKGG
jgi:flagellar assembly factor FliW